MRSDVSKNNSDMGEAVSNARSIAEAEPHSSRRIRIANNEEQISIYNRMEERKFLMSKDMERQNSGYDNLGFAKLDTERRARSGFPEVIYCSGKPDDYLVSIYQRMVELEGCAFGTRATPRQAELVRAAVPAATYDPVSRILKVLPEDLRSSGASEDNQACSKESGTSTRPAGRIAVCTGGTADIPVAEEAAQTAEYFGARVDRFYDVGVSGIHRLFSNMEEIRKADCVIAVAGMEGALPTVIGGMVQNPVIAVPTSVGYGANLKGVSALLTMINSCANGVAVVNIDNGYGAGYMATQIARLAASVPE